MLKLLITSVILGVLFKSAQASYCLKYTNSYWGNSYYTYIYCSNGCCGTSYSRYCCSFSGSGSGSGSLSSSYTGTQTSTSSFWAVGSIAGAAVGGFIGLCIVIGIVVVVIKECNKSGNRVQTLPPPRNNANMVATSIGGMPPPHAQPMYPPPAQPQHPPPYVGPGMPQPPASSAFPGP